jgi:uncharacterized membrane protein YdjX (TVP38/TMEM64 family)
MKRTKAFRLVVFLLALAGLAACLSLPAVRQTVAHGVAGFLAWVRGLGVWGPVALAGAYVAASVLLVPGVLLAWGAGYLFGPWVGTAAVSAGSTLGAAAAFGVGRRLARGLVEARLGQNPQVRALDAAVGEHGFKVVLLLRLSPVVPYNLVNYAFSLTRVRFRDFFLASWVGMFPATVFNVYMGSLLQSLAELEAGNVPENPARQLFFYAGLAVTVVVTVVLTRFAKSALVGAAPGVGDGAEATEAID